jgi:hypothetical protein
MIPNLRFPADRAKERYDALLKLMHISDRITGLGWRVDRELIASHAATAKEREAIYHETFLALSGLPEKVLGKAGTGQTKRVREWFLVDQKAPVVARDKHTKNPQVNTAALIEYATQYAQTPFGPAAAALYALRKNIKIQEFCRAYDILSRNDGRVHSSFFAFGTKTGRWTSSAKVRHEGDTIGCNIQQVPSKTPCFNFGQGPVELVESLRDIFIADEGCQIHSYDYEALELRLIAYIFGAQTLIDNLDGDPHTITAKALFREIYSKETAKKCRNAAKSCAYAISYSMHDTRGKGKYPTLLKTLKVDFPEMNDVLVKVIADRFFALYPEIKAGQLSAQAQIASEGYRELPINGRRLYYPDTMRGWNQGINFTFQGTGAELINRAIIELAPKMDWRVGGNYVLGQIHDELVLNVREEDWYKVYEWTTLAMSREAEFGAYKTGIPSKGVAGKCWPK